MLDSERLVGLRRCVLAASVLDAIDVLAGDDGVVLEGLTPLLVPWQEIDEAVGAADPDTDQGRRRLRTWLHLRSRLAELDALPRRLRAVGLPVGHALHPGRRWIRHEVHGGAIDVGLGVLGALDDPDEVIVIPPSMLAAKGIDPAACWPELAYQLEQTGRLAAKRLTKDPKGPLRPFGDFDVVTLLASSAFRAELCATDPVGWRTAAVPMRQRGWLDLGRIDPAFAAAAALATEPEERGFDRAILVTPEEVVVAPAGGQAAAHALLDPPASLDSWQRRT